MVFWLWIVLCDFPSILFQESLLRPMCLGVGFFSLSALVLFPVCFSFRYFCILVSDSPTRDFPQLSDDFWLSIHI